MKIYFEVLKKCALFKNIEEYKFEHLLQCINAREKTYLANEYIFFAGEQVDYVGVVLSGSMEVIKENAAGSKHIVAFLEPSQLFAEGIVCTSERISPVTVKVKENSKVLFIPYERIVKSCGNACDFHLQLVTNMMMILGNKNFILNSKIDLLVLKGMREKIATYLLNEQKMHNSLTFQITPNRNELAEYLNVSRTSMCRELARMKEENILDYYQNSFKINSLDALKECLIHE